MAIDILMPALSPTMELGTLAKWFVKKGDMVKPGDLLAEIETDKAIMEFEAVEEGKILQLLVEEGQKDIPVNSIIAKIQSEGSNNTDSDKIIEKQNLSVEKLTNENVIAAKGSSNDQNDNKLKDTTKHFFSTPLARRIAKERKIDLSKVKGSGPRGRIIKADIINEEVANQNSIQNNFNPTVNPIAHTSSTDITKAYSKRESKNIEIDGMRKTIISRLTNSKQTIPHYYLRRDIKIDSLINLRSQMNEGLKKRNIKISINDFIIKSCAMALQSVPECNVIWAEDRILSFAASDIAVAVAIKGGLLTPVLLDAEKKTLIEISVEMKSLAERARKRELKPQEYQGGSFSISSLGMMGIKSFDAVINPPHGSILAVGAAIKTPVVGEDGDISVKSIISVTLSADHRMIDGAIGAKFLEKISYNLENPGVILV
jgi:pyruvate dehydrogenase E2 component (dihydrolipoamide acetyltransferase)